MSKLLTTGMEEAYLLDYREKENIAFFRHYGDSSIFTRKEVEKIIKALQNFMESDISNQYIEEYNQRCKEAYQKDWEDMQYGRGRYATEPIRRSVITNTRIKKGYVYFIQEEMSGTVKIGRTINLKNRLKTFGVKLPFEWKTLHTIESNDYILTETLLHEHFKDQRKNGEWFELSEEDIKDITTGNFNDEIKSSIAGVGELYE